MGLHESLEALLERTTEALNTAIVREQHARKILSDFYRAPLSMASVQPILDLAVELNPDLKETK